MDKSINIEVLLKAAEYIEQTNNKGVVPYSFEFLSQSKRQFDCASPHSTTSLSDHELNTNVRIFNNSINNIKNQQQLEQQPVKQTNSLDNLKLKYAKTNEHKRDDFEEDQKINISRNKTTHNILEKNRRAHLKECFENLQNELPSYKDKKVTNLLILKQTCKYVEQSKKKEREAAMEIKRLLAQNIALMEQLSKLKACVSSEDYLVNLDVWINQNTNRIKEMKMLNYMASCFDENTTICNYDEENSKKFDSFESESSEFDSEYNENSKSN